MDGLVDIGSAPFRDARYGPRQVVVERRADGDGATKVAVLVGGSLRFAVNL